MPVTNGVTLESMPESIPFNIFNNDLDDGTVHPLNNPSDNTKLQGVANRPDVCAAVQRNLHRLEKWASRGLLSSIKRSAKSCT